MFYHVTCKTEIGAVYNSAVTGTISNESITITPKVKFTIVYYILYSEAYDYCLIKYNVDYNNFFIR